MLHRLFLFFLIIPFLGCEEEANIKYKRVALEVFDQIQLENAFDLFIIENSSYFAEIIADEKIIEHISFRVENKVLYIANNRKVKWRAPTKNKIRIDVSALPLKKIQAEEGSNIQTKSPITSEEFRLALTGKANQATLELQAKKFLYWNNFPAGGKLTLSGKVDELALWNFALMSVDAKNLVAKTALVENSSKGNCLVNITDQLEYSIMGEGNIVLYGNPAELIEKELSSSGRLIQQ